MTPPGVPSGLSGVEEFEHWSNSGSASPIIVPFSILLVVPPWAVAPLVWPLTTLMAPGVDGPNCVL